MDLSPASKCSRAFVLLLRVLKNASLVVIPGSLWMGCVWTKVQRWYMERFTPYLIFCIGIFRR